MYIHEEKTTKPSINDHLKDVMKIICGHEFNTPMASIMGLSEMLLTDRGEMTNKELDDYFLYILSSSKRLNNVSKRLGMWYTLSGNFFSKPDHFKVEFNDFLVIINQLNEPLAGDTTEKKIVVSGELDTLFLFGDKSYFLRSFIELLDNAIKFSNTQAPVYIEFAQSTNESQIRVINVSSMVSANELGEYRVFSQFNRQKYEQQGLGIGIEIAKLGAAHCHCYCQVTGKQNDQICQVTALLTIPFSDIDIT